MYKRRVRSIRIHQEICAAAAKRKCSGSFLSFPQGSDDADDVSQEEEKKEKKEKKKEKKSG